MTNTLRYKTTTFTLAALLTILSAFQLFAQADQTNTPTNAQNVTVGAFTAKVPTDWKAFSANDAVQLRREFMTQSQQIYMQFSGADDPGKTVDMLAFHIANGTGSFVLVSFTVPPTSNLITLLKSQVNDKMAFGVREGYIRKYLGLVSVDSERFSGFYTKVIGKSGAITLSGGLEHKSLRNTVIQLTLLSPGGWDEARATSTLSSILDSVALRGK